jgi:Ni,Fe-hydrogenase III large subunit
VIQRWVQGEQTLAESVLEACGTSVALGAYAYADAASYLFLDASGPYALSERLEADRPVRAVSAAYPAFAWDEREMADVWAVSFEDLPDPRPLRAKNGLMPAPVIAHGAGLMHFVVGPVHAGIIEAGRFTFSSGGETVVHLDAQLSYGHRGVEKQLEGRQAVQSAWMVARICGGCSASRSYAYALALEQLAGTMVGREVELARVALAELERIYNHLADLAASAAGAGWGPGFARGMALKERAMRLCQLASGHRLLFDAIAPGGVGSSVFRNRSEVREELDAFEPAVNRYLTALFDNVSVVSRWHGSGIVNRETANAFGAVGPAHRASRGDVDIRTFAPYGAYRWLPVCIAQASTGDAFARCRVKKDEIHESFRLIREAIAQLGKARIDDPQPLELKAGVAVTLVEGPRGAEIVAVHTDPEGRLSRLHVISASYRNWPIVTRAMDGNIVPDFPLVNKSFNLCYACADR